MNTRWTPQNILVLITISTSCLCLLIFVVGVVFGVMTEKIQPQSLGSITGAGIGGGLLGLGAILYQIIKVSLQGSSEEK